MGPKRFKRQNLFLFLVKFKKLGFSAPLILFNRGKLTPMRTNHKFRKIRSFLHQKGVDVRILRTPHCPQNVRTGHVDSSPLP